MNENLIILELFQHEVSCCCPKKHQHILEFHQGDVWIITKKKYDDSLGWHFLVTVNSEFQFHIKAEDIEELYNKGRICSILDLELKILNLNFKVNEALDEHDKESFILFTNELSNVQKVKDKMKFSIAF
ncbi:hypothetical protein ACQKND_05775 [Viridibacillus arvi]|uniref:hypothetical protein n=1 Tax=Viridibacillus arvi TaxID=263475 RepID=UPI003D036593